MPRLASALLVALLLGLGAAACGPDAREGGCTGDDCAASETPDAGETGEQPDAGDITPDPTPDAGSTTTPDAGTPACTTDGWDSWAKGFFSTNCTRCHSWASSYTSVKSRKARISSEISSGNMPQGGRLSASDKSRILQWLDCGVPR